MSKLNREREAILAEIDAIKTMIERDKASLDMFENMEISGSPIKALLSILRRCGVGYEELVDWLGKYLVYVTPVIELAVKGVILSKLKSNIDCNLDPRIPQYLREEIGGCVNTPFYGLFNDDNAPKKHIIINDIKIYVNGNKVVYKSKEYNVEKNSNDKEVVIIPTTMDDGTVEDVEYVVYEEIMHVGRGLEINLNAIDFYGMLNTSPMSTKRNVKYFGTNLYYTIDGVEDKKLYSYEDCISYCLKKKIDTKKIKKHAEIDSVYELARARDFNAFLWFVIHKAKFMNVGILDSPKSILGVIEGYDDSGLVSLGQAYEQVHGSNTFSVMGLCIKHKGIDESEELESATSNSGRDVDSVSTALAIQNIKENISQYEYTVVPTTNIWNGCNWYVNRWRYWLFYSKKPRDYDKEFALFRLEYKQINEFLGNKLIFTIKPLPNLILPRYDASMKVEKVDGKEKLTMHIEGDEPWNVRQIIFDKDGKQDWWGKYSVVIGEEEEDKGYDYRIYKVLSPHDKDGKSGKDTNVRLYFNKRTLEYELISKGSQQDIRSVLYECYKGTTIYEFNYDFLMGIQLFEGSTIVAQLIEGLCNIQLGINVRNKNGEYRERISDIVKKVISSVSSDVSTDCFYTFSNKEYDMMQENAEKRRAQLYTFQNVTNGAVQIKDTQGLTNILNEYNYQGDLNENIDVVTRTFTSASTMISEESYGEDKFEMEFNFIENAIELITAAYMEALLTPKMLMVFYINQKMMGDNSDEDWNIEYLLNSFMGLLISIVSENVEMLLQKLIEFALQKFKELLNAAIYLLTKEQLEFDTRLMKQLIDICWFELPDGSRLTTTLDKVDYADIDTDEAPAKEC